MINLKVILLAALGMSLLGVGAIALAYARTPIPDESDFRTAESTIVYWNDGETELGRFSDETENRISLPSLEEIPLHVRQAVLAAEDRAFYEHGGFDPIGIGRAVWNQMRGEAGGGSTVTQQYVKNYYLTNEQTLRRKVEELFISIKLEQRLSKDAILLDYLNTIWWGRGTLHGVQVASQSYFDKDVGDLTLEEGIALAAMIQNASRLDPTIEGNEERFTNRFRFVAAGMVEMGVLSKAEADALQPPEVQPRSSGNQWEGTNGYLLDAVKKELVAAGLDEQTIESGGLRITTTFDQKKQAAAVEAVENEFPRDEDGEPIEDLRAGLAAVEPRTGEVVAMYGGWDYLDRQVNNATVTIQAGSAVKPFGLVRALEDGISLDSRYHGQSPFDPPEIGRPVNNQGNYSWPHGDVDLLSATKLSLNTAFVDLTLQLDYNRVIDTMVDAGIPDDADGLRTGAEGGAGARAIIGIWDVSVVDLANSYATLAALGERADVHTVKRVVDPAGRELPEPGYFEPNRTQTLDRDAVADTTYALNQVIEGTPAGGRNPTGQAAQALERPAAGKTGTHDELTSLFAGYTPQLAAVVRYYDGENLKGKSDLNGKDPSNPGGGFAGGGIPARTWTAFMKAALEGEPVLPLPERADVGEPVNPTPTPCPEGFERENELAECVEIEPTEEPTEEPEPTCAPGFAGTPPDCRLIVEEPEEPEDPEVNVPNMVGETQNRAERQLRRAGFEVAVEFRELDLGTGLVGRVVEQRPDGGTLPPGETVTIVVGTAPDEPEDPCEQPGPPPEECGEDPPPGEDENTEAGAFGRYSARLEFA